MGTVCLTTVSPCSRDRSESGFDELFEAGLQGADLEAEASEDFGGDEGASAGRAVAVKDEFLGQVASDLVALGGVEVTILQLLEGAQGQEDGDL